MPVQYRHYVTLNYLGNNDKKDACACSIQKHFFLKCFLSILVETIDKNLSYGKMNVTV